MQRGAQILSSARYTSALTSSLSNTASVTKSRSAKSSSAVVVRMRANAAGFSSSL
jgi:phosphosulfolactate phosphohydrolase-like enzyme